MGRAQSKETRKTRALIADHQGTRKIIETREVSERERTFEAQSKETRKTRALIADHQGTRSGGGLSVLGEKEYSQGQRT